MRVRRQHPCNWHGVCACSKRDTHHSPALELDCWPDDEAWKDTWWLLADDRAANLLLFGCLGTPPPACRLLSGSAGTLALPFMLDSDGRLRCSCRRRYGLLPWVPILLRRAFSSITALSRLFLMRIARWRRRAVICA